MKDEIIIKVKVPAAKTYLIQNDCYEVLRLIEKQLTKKWFGCGCFECTLIKNKKEK